MSKVFGSGATTRKADNPLVIIPKPPVDISPKLEIPTPRCDEEYKVNGFCNRRFYIPLSFAEILEQELISVQQDSKRMDFLCRCNAGDWEKLNDIRLSKTAGYLRQAVDDFIKR